MEVAVYNTPEEFLIDAGEFLSEHEAENNLILGIAAARTYAEYHLYSVKEYGQAVLAALMTPPHNMILTAGPAESVSVLADYLKDNGIELPGVTGPADTGRSLAETLGGRYRITMEQLIYECRAVVYTGEAPGICRPAERNDAEMLVKWMSSFHSDVGLTEPVETLTERVLERIEQGTILVWVDNLPVSMGLSTGKTPHGIRVGGVYTPPEYRNRGYATSNIAALTQRMFDQGHKFCFLYTDKSNPVSNSIYQKIGYRQVSESIMVRFG